MSELAMERTALWPREDVLTAIRRVLREEQRWDAYLDDDGYWVFANENAYRRYLNRQKGKSPSEVKAYYLDAHGLKIRYSDWEPTPEKARELESARRETTVPAEMVWAELREMGVEI